MASGRVVVTAKAPVAKPAARIAVYFILKDFGRCVGLVEDTVGNGNECMSACVERVLYDSK